MDTVANLILNSKISDLDKIRLKAYNGLYDRIEPNFIRYAAFPILLTSDLLYKIFANFHKNVVPDDGELPIWWVGELLHSPIVREVGYDLYEIYPTIRNELIKSLEFNENERLAYFMKYYLEFCRHKVPTMALFKAEELNYKFILDPLGAMGGILKQISAIKSIEKNNIDHVKYLLVWGNENLAKSSAFSGKPELQYLYQQFNDYLDGLKVYKETTNTEKSLDEGAAKILKALSNLPISNEAKGGYNIPVPPEVWEKLDRKGMIDANGNLQKKKRKVYALLVGIDFYPNSLGGCVNDVKKIEHYIRNTEPLVECIILSNQNASKQAIIDQLQWLVKEAGEGDTVLFYFAGYGALVEDLKINYNQEKQWEDKTSWEKSPKVEEAIVFYHHDYELDNFRDFILTKKQILYLVQKVVSNNPHIVTIYDCCHLNYKSRDGGRFHPQNKVRGWASVFPAQAGYNSESDMVVRESLSNLQYVELTASGFNEVAMEVTGYGAFTGTLLRFLEDTGGEVSYKALIGRMSQYMRNVYEQIPRMQTTYNLERVSETCFLNSPWQGTLGEVSYKGNYWILNLGFAHGVRKINKVIVIDNMSLDGNTKKVVATIEKVYTYSTVLANEPLEDLKKEEIIYKARLEGFELEEVKIHLNNYNGNFLKVQDLLESVFNNEDYIVFEDKEEDADYVIHIRNGKIYVTYPNDVYRPLIEPFELNGDSSIENMGNALRHIARWHYIKNMKGFTEEELPSNPLGLEVIRVTQDGREENLQIEGNKVVLEYENIKSSWRGNIKIKVQNTSDLKLYINTLYFSTEFSISTYLSGNSSYELEPGNSFYLNYKNSELIPIYLDDVAREYNWRSVNESVKLIISKYPFDSGIFYLDPLPKQFSSTEKGIRGISNNIDFERREINLSEWTMQALHVEFVNPEYNRISGTRLREMLTWDKMVDFALGNYYNVEKGKYLQPYYVLKSEIQLMPD